VKRELKKDRFPDAMKGTEEEEGSNSAERGRIGLAKFKSRGKSAIERVAKNVTAFREGEGV